MKRPPQGRTQVMSTFSIDPARDHVPGDLHEHRHELCPNCERPIVPQELGCRGGYWRHEHASDVCEEGDDLSSPCYMVEFAVLWDDHTWSTTIEEVPMIFSHERCTSDDLVNWAHAVLAPQTRFRKSVQFSVYNISPETF